MKERKMTYDINEMPPIGKSIVLAIQHLFAMFGATILVPILVNAAALPPSRTNHVFPQPGKALIIIVFIIISSIYYIPLKMLRSPICII